ncbi:MAG: 50S ribosomal protein L11 [Nanoarchaeota archaeon]|nr:50S ribosomal protein L11 [Nanoarchaeota archaeon]
MSKTTIKLLISGGKASAGPPLGPALAPLKMNIQEIVKAINDKTKDFAGIDVPVSVVVDTTDKSYKIVVGSPPTSSLIKKELGLQKLSKAAFGTYTPKEGEQVVPFIGDLTMDQIIKIAKAKGDNLLTHKFKSGVKQIASSCVSNGCTIEGKHPKEIVQEIEEGVWDEKING